MILWISCIIGGYAIGSIPFGLIIGLSRGVDVRTGGSGNIGATNVARMVGRKFGVICFVLDFLKGAAPVITAGLLAGTMNTSAAAIEPANLWWWMAVAVSPVLGHMFSPFLKFKGGKGVATAFGAMASMWPILTFAAIAAVIVWITTVKLSRYVSLGSVNAVVSLPIGYAATVAVQHGTGDGLNDLAATLGRTSAPLVVTALLAALVVYKHRANLQRIRKGTEPRIGENKRENGDA